MHLRATNFYGGPERQILKHAELVNPVYFEVILSSFSESGRTNELLDYARARNLHTFEIPVRNAYDPSAIPKLKIFLRTNHINILCTHGYRSNLIGYLATRFTGIPIVAFSRGWTKENLKITLFQYLDRVILRLVDRVVAVSKAKEKELLQLGIPSHKVRVIHNSIALEDFDNLKPVVLRQELGLDREAKIIASAGRLSPEKGQEFFLRAAALVLKDEPESYFVIFGDGQERDNLEILAEELNIKERVFFAGFRKDFASYLKEIGIFVNPSLSEGLPNVVLEAFALAKPVVATDVGGTPELVYNQKTGILVPPKNSKELAEGILFCLRNPAKAKELGLAAQELVKERFNFQKQTEELEGLYWDVLKRQHNE